MTAARALMNRILVIRGGAHRRFHSHLAGDKARARSLPESAYRNPRLHAHRGARRETFLRGCGSLSRIRCARRDFSRRIPRFRPGGSNYFASFDLIVSYLFDPDGIFQSNLTRGGAKMLHCRSIEAQTTASMRRCSSHGRWRAARLAFNRSGREVFFPAIPTALARVLF